MGIKRAYRFRIYPTPEQAHILARTFGCARFGYNHMLRLRTDAWFARQERIGYHETSTALTQLKKAPEFAWLNEVSSVPVQQALRHLQTAFANFFAKRAGYPTFKRKDWPQSAEYTTSALKWDGKTLKLAKMDVPLDVRFSRTLPHAAKVTTVTVSKDAAGRYFVSMLCDDTVQPKAEVAGKVGIDLGLTHFAILSTGEKVAAPNRGYRPLVSVQQAMQRLRAYRIEAAVECARVGVPGMRHTPRPRHQRSAQRFGGRTGRVSPWRICKSDLHLSAVRLDSVKWESPFFRKGSSQENAPLISHGVERTPFSLGGLCLCGLPLGAAWA